MNKDWPVPSSFIKTFHVEDESLRTVSLEQTNTGSLEQSHGISMSDVSRDQSRERW